MVTLLQGIHVVIQAVESHVMWNRMAWFMIIAVDFMQMLWPLNHPNLPHQC